MNINSENGSVAMVFWRQLTCYQQMFIPIKKGNITKETLFLKKYVHNNHEL